ncbi:MAG: alpha/beta hydrolase [Sphingomonadales bacterium]|jgi:pimeloyl-ACP methyl ester carboxylesterase
MAKKPPLLLIHGMWAKPRLWQHMTDAFEAAGYEVINPPLPFHDVEPGEPAPEGLGTCSLNDYVAFLEREAAKCEATPIIIGHSMGGLIAQLLAARISPPLLILLSPAPSAGLFALYPSVLRTMGALSLSWGYWNKPTMISEKAARYGIFNNVGEPEATQEVEALVHDSGRVLFEMSAWFLDKSRAAKVDFSKLTMPTFIRVGDVDRVTPKGVARQTARRIPGPVDYGEIPGFGHWIVGAENGPKLGQDIVEFLNSHTA